MPSLASHDVVMEDYDGRNRRGYMFFRDRNGRRPFVIREAQPLSPRTLTMGELTHAEDNPAIKLTWFQDTWIKGIGGLNWRIEEDRGKLQSSKKIETYPHGHLRPAREARTTTVDIAATTDVPSGFASAPFDSAPDSGFENEVWAFIGRETYSLDSNTNDDAWTQETTPQTNDTYYKNAIQFDKWLVAPGWWGGTDMTDVAMPYIYKARTDTSWTASTLTAGRFKYFAKTRNNANTMALWGGNHVFDTGLTLSGAHNNSTTTIVCNADPTATIAVGDIIICGVGDDAEQEPMLVTAVTNPNLTVVRAYGDTAVTYEGGEKIHLYQPHVIKSSTEVSNGAGSWSTATVVGQQEYPITGLAVDEDTDSLLIAKTDGLWQQFYEPLEEGGRLFLRNLTIQFRGQGHSTNFQGIHVWNKHVLLPLGGGGLLDYNVASGEIRDISFSITMPELTTLHGQIVAITSSANCVWVLVKDPDSESLALLEGHFITVDGVTGWAWQHKSVFGAGAALNLNQATLWYDCTRDDHDRVWIGFAESAVTELPRYLPVSTRDIADGYTNDTDAEATLLRYDANLPRVPKHLDDIEIESRNLGTGGKQWTYSYRVDSFTASFTTGLGIFNSPFQKLDFPRGIDYKILELKLAPGMTSVGDDPPEIISVRVTSQVHYDPAKVFPMDLYLADSQFLLNGAQGGTIKGDLAQLNTWNASAADLTLFTPDQEDGRVVLFMPGSLEVQEVHNEIGRRPEYRVRFQLVEV
jgi:hypothetical protein